MSNTSAAIDGQLDKALHRPIRNRAGTDKQKDSTTVAKPPVVSGNTTVINPTEVTPATPDENVSPIITGPTPIGAEPPVEPVAELVPIYNDSQKASLAKFNEKRDDILERLSIADQQLDIAEKLYAREKVAKKRDALGADADKKRRTRGLIIEARIKVEKQIEGIVAYGAKRAQLEANKATKEAKKNAPKPEKALVPKYDSYETHPLTSEQYARRSQLEEEANKSLDEVNKNLAAFVTVAEKIKEERLYEDFEGGFPAYIQNTFGFSVSQFNRILLHDRVGKNITAMLALPAPPKDGEGNVVTLDAKVLPTKESHSRVLSKAGDSEDQVKAWGAVTRRVKNGDVLSGTLITEEVNKVRTKKGLEPITTEAGKARDEAAEVKAAAPVVATKESSNLNTAIPESAWKSVRIAVYRGHEYRITEESESQFTAAIYETPTKAPVLYSGPAYGAALKILNARAEMLAPDDTGNDAPELERVPEDEEDTASEI